MIKKIIAWVCFVCPLLAHAQDKATSYPKDYFRNPLDIPIFLAGNFGECRPGHFHSGIDIKTQGKENQQVHAAADGYISRIKMDKGGFGHAIYITHPNGYTTLYGHLNEFAPAIQQYLRTQQYAQQRWDLDLQLTPSQFPVKKGQLIAMSGNTGASTAPHLHFEIRDSRTEHPLNPEQFGLPIRDKLPPVPLRVAVYNLNNGFYNQAVSYFPLKKMNGVYTSERPEGLDLPLPQADTCTMGIGLEVNDYMEGSDNTLAHYKSDVYVNDSLYFGITLDDIGYDETRYINAYADYRLKKMKGFWSQCLFQLPGNRLNTIYKDTRNTRGCIPVVKGVPMNIRVVLTDDFGNVSTVAFRVGFNNVVKDIKMSMGTGPATKTMYANKPNSFEGNNLKFEMNDRALYDSVEYRFIEKQDDKKLSPVYEILTPAIPLHTTMQVSIRPNKLVPFTQRDKVVLVYTDGDEEDGQSAAPGDMGWYKAGIRNFGTCWLAVDTTAPVIKAAQKQGANLNKAKEILFTVTDNMTSVKKFKGLLDGKWICFEQHSNRFFYVFDEHCPAGKHKLVFTAEDENRNSSSFTYTFTR